MIGCESNPSPERKRRVLLPRASAWGSDLRHATVGRCAAATIAMLVCTTTAGAEGIDDSVTERFIQHVAASDDYDVSAKAFVARRWVERVEAGDTQGFLIEALALLSDEFRAGLAAFDQECYADCAGTMGPLTHNLNPYLAANAAVYQIKALVAGNDLERAQQKIVALLALPQRLDLFTQAAAEIHYLKGYCELGNLEYAQATRSLLAMLEQFPDAPQRLLITAGQMLAELGQRVPDGLGDVTDLLTYATRRLANADTGQRVQERQQRAIEILEELIEAAEQQEQSSGGGGGGQSGGQRSPGGSQNPMPDSRLPPGSADTEPRLRRRTVRPGEAWGAMKPADRARIVQVLKDNFPDRYRRLIEQYYEELAEEP